MGADFMVAIAALPHRSDGKHVDLTVEQATKIIHSRIAGIDDAVLYDLLDLYRGLDGDDTIDKDRDSLLWLAGDMCKEALGNNRDTTVREIGGRYYLLTGGMSWGDTPTDSFDNVGLMGDLAVFDEPLTPEEELACDSQPG